MSTDERLTVTVPTGRDDTTVLLTNPSRPFEDAILDFEIHIDAPGLTVRTWTRTLDGDHLDEFLGGLVDDFRGWTGVRDWRSMEGDFRLEAEHVHGRVRLNFIVERDYKEDAWHTLLPLTILPGEELTALATDVGSFFDESPSFAL